MHWAGRRDTLVSSVQENCLNSEVVEQIYKRNPILRYSHHPLHSPLLPLPYGDVHLSGESRRRAADTRHEDLETHSCLSSDRRR